MLEKLKSLFQTSRDDRPSLLQPAAAPTKASREPAQFTRMSNGLEQFFFSIAGQGGMKILDLCGSPVTTKFLFEREHTVRPDAFHRALELAFGNGPEYLERQLEEDRIAIFVEHTLNHEEGEFDAVLLWDAVQFLRPELLTPALEQIRRITRPGAPMLAIFHADERADTVPVFSYQIHDHNVLHLAERERRRPAQHFNNRAIERVFSTFGSTKFFLARNQLREVLVRR